MLPTNDYLHITGQFSQDIKHSCGPWGGGSLKRLGSEHSCLWLDPLADGDGDQANKPLGFYIADE